MTRGSIRALLAFALLAAPLAVEAQQAGKVYRIGILVPGGSPASGPPRPLERLRIPAIMNSQIAPS
jgi:hypothetical protein